MSMTSRLFDEFVEFVESTFSIYEHLSSKALESLNCFILIYFATSFTFRVFYISGMFPLLFLKSASLSTELNVRHPEPEGSKCQLGVTLAT